MMNDGRHSEQLLRRVGEGSVKRASGDDDIWRIHHDPWKPSAVRVVPFERRDRLGEPLVFPTRLEREVQEQRDLRKIRYPCQPGHARGVRPWQPNARKQRIRWKKHV